MTLKKNDIRLSLFLLIFLIIGIIGLNSCHFYDENALFDLTKKWCVIPLVLISLFWSYRITFGYDTSQKFLKNTLGFIVMTIISMMLLYVSFEGNLLIINSYIGKQQDYLITGEVIKLKYPENKKMLNHYSIIIQLSKKNDSVELIVPTNEYIVGDKFEQDMKIGSLGVLYK